MEGTTLHRIILATVFGAALIGASSMPASAAPNPGPARITNDGSAPIVQVDEHCGHGRHYVPRHYVKGHHDSHGHYIKGHYIEGRCVHS
jgi:hypothetical protein